MNKRVSLSEAKSLLPAEWFPKDISAPPPDPAKYKSVDYKRVSTMRQSPFSLVRQGGDTDEYAKAEGLTSYRSYTDRGKSGTSMEGREELELLLIDARAGKFRHLIVETVDRLGRDYKDNAILWDEFEDLGITIHATDCGVLTLDVFAIKSAQAEGEIRRFVKRVQKRVRADVTAGESFGAAKCFGYKRLVEGENVTFVIDESNPETGYVGEADIVREIFGMFLRGLSPGKIAKILNKRPPEKRGNRFWKSTMIAGSPRRGTGILRRTRYYGRVVYGRIKSKSRGGKTIWTKVQTMDKWSVAKEIVTDWAIVTEEEFDRAQRLLNERTAASRGEAQALPRWTSKNHPLRGKYRCAACERGMTPTKKTSDGRPRLLCNGARNKPFSCDKTVSVPLDIVDESVVRVLKTNLASPASLARMEEEYSRLSQAVARKTEHEITSQRDLVKKADERLEELRVLKKKQESGASPEEAFAPGWLAEKIAAANDAWDAAKQRLDEMEVKRLEELQEMERKAERARMVPDFEAIKALAQTLDEAFGPDFDTSTAPAAKVVTDIQALMEAVIVDLRETELHLTIRVRGAADARGKAEIHSITDVVARPGRLWGDPASEGERQESLVGRYAVPDAIWSLIEPRIPKSVACSKRGKVSIDLRVVMEAALLHVNEGIPLRNMPANLGPRKQIGQALIRLSDTGGWQSALDVLQKHKPEWVKPQDNSKMFATLAGSTTSLKGLPAIKAKHGLAAAGGLHAPTETEWAIITDLVPEQVTHVGKADGVISPRELIHAMFFILKENIPRTHAPLCFGSTQYLYNAMQRLVGLGCWDRIVDRLAKQSPQTLDGTDLSRFDNWHRSSARHPVFKRSLADVKDRTGVPAHAPTEAEWALMQHLFPADILYVGDVEAIDSARKLAHAIMYRVKAGVPTTVFPEYFGDGELVNLTIRKFVFHHLWDRLVELLQAKSPATLDRADLGVFARYKRGKSRRYRHLYEAPADGMPPHAPSDEQWSMVGEFFPVRLMAVRGGPPLMEPRKFFHALLYMWNEKVGRAALPPYFGDNYKVWLVIRRFASHHLLDGLIRRMEHCYPEWADKVDLHQWDFLRRSANPDPEFRQRKPRVSRREIGCAYAGDAATAG
jgi:DNA invertase Pin-like site-specific DNA recombinase/transposase